MDGTNVQAGAAAARQLIAESEEKYGRSCFFLFFRGRAHRVNVLFVKLFWIESEIVLVAG